MRHDYFEGVLQLRNPSDEVISTVRSLINSNSNVNLAKTEKSRNGVDLYISSQKHMITLGRTLQQKFGGQLIISRRIHTRSRVTSRDVYRVTVLFRLPSFKKGDTIKYRGKLLLILNLGKKVFCKDIESGKKMMIGYEKIIDN